MQKKSQDFSMEDALHLANSPAGKQLMSMLQRLDTSTVEQAAEAVSAGNYEKAGKTLESFLSSPEAKRLLKELGGNRNG